MNKALTKNVFYTKIFFIVVFFLLFAQLFRIQVLEHEKWLARSKNQYEFNKTFHANRGSVYFSDGSPLAITQLAYGIYGLPQNFKEKEIKNKGITIEKFAKDAAETLKLDESYIKQRLNNSNKIYEVVLAHKVDPEQYDELVKKYPKSLNLWRSEEESKRVYPNHELASKIIGFVGKDYNGNDVGMYGIEQAFDGLLSGSEGIFEGKKDRYSQIIASEDFENINSLNGADITLTIDRNIQKMVEERMKYYFDAFKARSATAVVMEPNTGRILAIADFPTYDPNEYWKGEKVYCDMEIYVLNEECNKKEEEKKVEEKKDNTKEQENFYPEGYAERLKKIQEEKKRLEEEEKKLNQEVGQLEVTPNVEKVDERIERFPEHTRKVFRKQKLPSSEIYRDIANSYLYEPGSVMKTLTLAISYNFNGIPRDPNYQLGGHEGCIRVADRELCTAGKVVRPSLTVEDMLKVSDNVGAIRVSESVKKEDFISTYQKLGLGNQTGVELADESQFQITDPKYWNEVDRATAAYGQGSIAMTPIQLTNAWNILASGGKSFKTTIIKKINNKDKEQELNPKFIEQVISEDAARDALNVTALSTADGYKVGADFYKKYSIAGKTGTANIAKTDGVGYEESALNMSYVGTGPIENPQFTMLVWFREPQFGLGGTTPLSLNTAQEAWNDMAERIMIMKGVPPKAQ